MQRLLVLFAHGARDPKWAVPFKRLCAIAQAQAVDTAVALAFLDFMRPSLSDVVRQAAQDGCREVTVAPVFFGQGGHVLRDLPVLAAQLRREFPQLVLTVVDAVGESRAVLEAIARYCLDAQNASGAPRGAP